MGTTACCRGAWHRARRTRTQYYETDKTGRKVMKQEGNEAVEEKRRAVVIRKRGELWKVEEERMKRGE